MNQSSMPSIQEIENFIINNEDLSKIESHINRFNPIRVMKMERRETSHSAILGWLLNPKGNHGLGNLFLKRFLAEALKNSSKDIELAALDINTASLSGAIINIEWNNIDIFIECPNNKWIFIIENKVDSSQSNDQLSKYRKFVEERYEGYKIIGIYLTLNDENPEDERYCPIRYHELIDLINMSLDEKKDLISNEVFHFIKYYKEIISSELCDMNEEDKKIQRLAKTIYQEHKNVIDFVVDYGASTEFQNSVCQLLKTEESTRLQPFTVNNCEYRFFDKGKNIFSFLPIDWIDTLGDLKEQKDSDYRWYGCEKWWHRYPIICWIELGKNNTLRLYAEVGSLKDYDLRQKLIKHIKEQKLDLIEFSSKAEKENAKYSKFLKQKKFSNKDIDAQDSEQITGGFDKLFNVFENIVKPIDEALKKFMSEINR